MLLLNKHLASANVAAIRHLSRAPITEALLDVRVVPAKDLNPERLKDAKELLRARFPRAEERRVTEARFAIQQGHAPKTLSSDLGFQGIWLRAADEKEVGQFRIDGFTFNRLKPYTSWDVLLPTALDLWDVYVKVARPQSVTRIAVRYINHLPLESAPVRLDDFVVTGPRVPEGIPDVINRFSSRVLLECPQKKIHANVTQALEVGVQSTALTLLLDIDAFKAGHLSTERSVLEPLFIELRAYKNRIFFGSLTEEYVRTFE